MSNITNTIMTEQRATVYESSSVSTIMGDKTGNDNARFKDALTESVVDTYKRRHPDDARHVEQQVRAGKSVREKNGGDISTEDMTMEEYQAYFYALLDTIPYDSTQLHNTNFLTISEQGWEQMRKDPDYEAWILGYFVEDRSVHNPFFCWGNNAGSICTEYFGASIEEHHGEGISKAALKGNADSDDDEEDWWIKRHKRMKKLLREQVERNRKKDAVQKSAAQAEYAKQQYLTSQRQHSFLTTGTIDPQAQTTPNPEGAAAAAAAYASSLNLFATGILSNIH